MVETNIKTNMKKLTPYWKHLGLAAAFAATLATAQAVIVDSPSVTTGELLIAGDQIIDGPAAVNGDLHYSTVCFSVSNPGAALMPTYFDATLQGKGLYDSWCVTPDTEIVYGATYTALMLTPEEAAGYVMHPQNFDLVLWIINQEFVGQASPGGYGNYTMGDVQNAIWLLIDDSISVDQGPYDDNRVNEIKTAALQYGEGFVPKCGDREIKVLVPVAEGCVNTGAIVAIAQVILIEIPVQCGPGTGTPGYWANHPEAWPVEEIEIGGITYTKEEAIDIMLKSVRNDKRYTLFPALVCAKLNVLIGNESSCIADTIEGADAWWALFESHAVTARSEAWRIGEPLYLLLDQYNNGLLCAPHRN